MTLTLPTELIVTIFILMVLEIVLEDEEDIDRENDWKFSPTCGRHSTWLLFNERKRSPGGTKRRCRVGLDIGTLSMKPSIIIP